MREIHDVLHRYPPDCQYSRIEPLGSANGMSGAQFWRITAPRGVLVLRRWPQEHPLPNRLGFIHAVLRHAAERGIRFLPLPITTRDGPSFLALAGHLWELAPWLPGRADYEHSPTIDKLQSAMTALAGVHVAVADFPQNPPPLQGEAGGGSSAVNRHIARLHKLSHGGANELSRAITGATWPELVPMARQFMAVLPRAVPCAIAQLEPLAGAPLSLQPCIRDIWHDHVLFTGNKVTGLIDFGALDIDTPATDIARLLGSLVGDDPAGWQTGLAAYSTVRPLADEEILAAKALDTSGTILAGCNWIQWIYVENRQFENRAQVIERFRRLAARWALAS